jgi:hypothetical protein
VGHAALPDRSRVCAERVAPTKTAYHAREKRYPAALDELKPDYLMEIPAEVNGMEITYRPEATGYSLEFSYSGPGMNHCAYTPEKGWRCTGFW